METNLVSASDFESIRHSLIRERLSCNQPCSPILRIRVYGESMLPALWPGDIVEIVGCASNDLQVGDILFCARDDRFFLHRMISNEVAKGFVLLGDSMPRPDTMYSEDALVGRLIRRSKGGHLSASVFLRRGFGAKLSRVFGTCFCHWNFARRVALGIHRRLREFAGNRQFADQASSAKSRELEVN